MSGAPADQPDTGDVLDTGPSEIEIERKQAGVPDDGDSSPAAPPETELPPD